MPGTCGSFSAPVICLFCFSQIRHTFTLTLQHSAGNQDCSSCERGEGSNLHVVTVLVARLLSRSRACAPMGGPFVSATNGFSLQKANQLLSLRPRTNAILVIERNQLVGNDSIRMCVCRNKSRPASVH